MLDVICKIYIKKKEKKRKKGYREKRSTGTMVERAAISSIEEPVRLLTNLLMK
jgi:predicted DNA-binding WGR domain protein